MPDSAHMLAEIKENIARKDPIKARLVLAYLENVDRGLREQVLGAFRAAAPDFAVPVLARFISEHRGEEPLNDEFETWRRYLTCSVADQLGTVLDDCIEGT